MRAPRWWLHVLLAIAALGGALVLAVAWLVATPGGARLIFDRIAASLGKGVAITGVEGSLWGTLRVGSIEVVRPDLVIVIRDLVIERSPEAFWSGRAAFARVEAALVDVRTASSEAAAKVPLTFEAPYPLRVEAVRVGELRIGTLPKAGREASLPVVVKSITLAAEGDKRAWKVERGAAETPWGRVGLAGMLATTRPFTLDVRGDLAGERDELRYRIAARLGGTLTRIEAKVDAEERDVRANATAVVEPFDRQPLRSLKLVARDVDLSRYAKAPRTRLSVDASIEPAAQGFAASLRLANAEPGALDRDRVPVVSAEGRAHWTHEGNDLVVELADARLVFSGGGTAQGSARWRPDRIEAQARIADVDAAQWHARLRPTKLTGSVAVVSDAAGQRFEGAVSDPRFAIEGAARLANARLEVEAVRLKHASGLIEGKGSLAFSGRRELRFEGHARHFDPSAFVKDAPGDLNFDFVASGALEPVPSGEVALDIAPSRFADMPASGKARIAGDAKRIASADVHLVLGDARLDAKGSLGRVGDSMEIAFQAPNLGAALKPLGIAVAGKADGRGTLTGTFAAPGARFALNASNLVVPGGVYATVVNARGDIATEADGKVDVTLEAQNVSRRAGETVRPIAQHLAVTVAGTRAAHRAALAANIAKDAELRAVLQGGLDPRAQRLLWRGEISSLSLTGPSAFDLGSPATLVVGADRAELGDATLKGAWGVAHFATTRWAPDAIEVRGSSPGIMIRNAARALHLAAVPRGNLVIAAEWDVRAAQDVDGFVAIRRTDGDLRVGDPPQRLGLEELNLRIEARRGQARATASIRGPRIGRIEGEVSGSLHHVGAGMGLVMDAPISGRIDAQMESLEWIAALMGPEGRAAGHVGARVAIAGTAAEPRFSGRVEARDVSLREPASGFEFDKGTAVLVLDDRRLVVEQLSISTPWRPSEQATRALAAYPKPDAGTLSATGAIDLRLRTGAITVKAQAVPVMQLATRFLALSGEAKIEARSDGVLATGALRAEAGWIGALATALPSVSDDVVVRRAAAADARSRERLRMDVRFNLGDNLWYRGRGLETKLAGELRVVGEIGAGMRGTGSIRTVAGTYDAYGRKLSIEHGTLTFYGSIENPALDVLALRKGLPVEAGVEVLGNVSRPRVRLVSQPDVPDPEKISWLVLGRAPGDVSQGEAALLASAATSLLGRSSGESITKRFGFDEVKVGRSDTVLGVLPESTVAGKTGTASGSDVVTVGKRLTKDVYAVYEFGLANAEGALRVTWQITQSFQLLGRAGYLSGIDAVYRWTFE